MLILLEPENKILYETCFSTFKRILVGDENTEEKLEVLQIDSKFCDFDGARFRASISPDDGLSTLKVSLFIPCWGDLEALGAKDHLKDIYQDLLVSTTDADYNVTLSINLKSLPQDYAALAKKISLFKFHALGGPFQKYFKALKDGKASPAGKIRLSDDTTIFFSTKNDRVVVIFSLHFKDKRDEVVAKVFLNSLVDVKRSIGPVPVVSFDMNPPNEMKQDFNVQDKLGNCGFFSVAVLPRHVATQEKIDLAVGLLQSFRNYLSYHIKCSNTYFHSRMRLRVKELMQVLNRAKTEDEEAAKKKKTASGRKFEQK